MKGSWSRPAATSQKHSNQSSSRRKTNPRNNCNGDTLVLDKEKYNALIVDSGAIIKHTGFSTLQNAATTYYTSQGVYNEIRDSKARKHLESLPFELKVREPSSEGMLKVVEFSRKTGDYASLSAVDLQILGLLYDLENEGCENMSHIRTDPKLMLGLGKVTYLNQKDLSVTDPSVIDDATQTTLDDPKTSIDVLDGGCFFEGQTEEGDDLQDSNHCDDHTNEGVDEVSFIGSSTKPKSWAALVNPSASSITTNVTPKPEAVSDTASSSTSGSTDLGSKTNVSFAPNGVTEDKDSDLGGQFSDAEDDESIEIPTRVDNREGSDDDSYEYCDDDGISDEECEVYIQDAEVVNLINSGELKNADRTVAAELDRKFPSLSSASTIPYDGSDNEASDNQIDNARIERLLKKDEEDKRVREASLQPLSKDGKVFNSFLKYRHIVSTTGLKEETKSDKRLKKPAVIKAVPEVDAADSQDDNSKLQTRVIGGVGMSGQGTEVDDDGEGWISSTKQIAVLKANGSLHPSSSPNSNQQVALPDSNLPSNNCRAACATTDFAMQNVILQMNLELLSVDGVRVSRLKSWVTRCGACYKVYTGSENDGKRLFCGQCGSDRLQRIAASLNGKTGRMRLHLRKDYRHNIRGTKFNLPNPGKGNQFMGDLLLREDQLLYGAWNQRMKQSKSKKGKESIFGSDVASTVGCHADLTKRDDICVGFGRKNPNASKFGRERRGKKKKSTDNKVCGLRRY